MDFRRSALGKVYVFEEARDTSTGYELGIVGGGGDQFKAAFCRRFKFGLDRGVDLGAVNAGAVFVYSGEGESLHQLLAIEQSIRFGASMSRARTSMVMDSGFGCGCSRGQWKRCGTRVLECKHIDSIIPK